eukprot:9261951-Pyramimonas_sp.AAC.1
MGISAGGGKLPRCSPGHSETPGAERAANWRLERGLEHLRRQHLRPEGYYSRALAVIQAIKNGTTMRDAESGNSRGRQTRAAE